MANDDSPLRRALRHTLLRDLKSLEAQIGAYPDDESVWRVVPGITNSAGTLALHMAGNLRHFFGAVLGESGYVRDRAGEFSSRNIDREDVITEVRLAAADVSAALDRMDDDRLAAAYPLPVAERNVGTGEFLVHLAGHLTYHLGQVDYHRRILTNDAKPVDNLSVKELPLAD